MKLSLLHELDIREAARRVVILSREQLRKVVGYDEQDAAPSDANPYIEVFVALYHFVRNDRGEAEAAEIHLNVAESVLGSPLYTGAEGEIESPLLQLVIAGARARLKLRRGEVLTPEEKELF